MENRHNPDFESSQTDEPAEGGADARTAQPNPDGGAPDPVPDLGPPVTPRAFALCVDGYDPDDYPEPGGQVDPEMVFAWGLAAGGDTIIYRPLRQGERSEYGVFSSAESARALFSRVLPLRLVWF